jgi:hypothetical protein
MRPPWTCQENVGNLGTPMLASSKVLPQKSIINGVATLAFGSQPRQGGCKVAGLIVDPGVTSHAPGSAKSVRE